MKVLWICDFPPRASLHSFLGYYIIREIKKDFHAVVTDSLCYLKDAGFSPEKMKNVDIHFFDPSWGGCEGISHIWAYKKCCEIMKECDGIIGMGRDYKLLIPRLFDKWVVVQVGERLIEDERVFSISLRNDADNFSGAPRISQKTEEGIEVFAPGAQKSYLRTLRGIDGVRCIHGIDNFPTPWLIGRHSHALLLPTKFVSFRYLNIFLTLLFSSSGISVAAYPGSMSHWASRTCRDYFCEVKNLKDIRRWFESRAEPDRNLNDTFKSMVFSLREFYKNFFS